MDRFRKMVKGAIILEDGETSSKNVVCTRGAVVKDLIDRVTQDLDIVPILRPFFALCNPRSCVPLNIYHSLTQEEAKKQYQLRVFVNTGENSFLFFKICKPAYHYYYHQLKEDFIADRLFPRATINTALWMAAIDIARAAHAEDLNFRDVIASHKDLGKFMPKFLKEKCKKDEVMEKKLLDNFCKFREIRGRLEGLEHYEAKYMEVYEKDAMCGKHIFRLKSSESKVKKNATLLVVLSWKEGVYQIWAGESSETKQEICSIRSIASIHVDNLTITLSLRDKEDSTDEEHQEKKALNFFDKEESHSFAVTAQTYYQLMVDANTTIITGTMTPSEDFLKVNKNPGDGFKAQLCHAPIAPYYVMNMLTKNGMITNGNFLIRESRNTNSAYTLSLCYQGSVMNYRIINDPREGFSFQDPEGGEEAQDVMNHKVFRTMVDLIEHHKQNMDGLPALLKMNYAPNVTGPIPLLRVMPERSPSNDSLINPSPTSPFPPPFGPHFNDGASTSSSESPNSSNSSTYMPTNDQPPSPLHNGSGPPPMLLNPLHIDRSHDSLTESPYIQELIKEGVAFVQYSELITKKELGHGHYSTVYLAELGSGENLRKVAVKIPTMKETNVDLVKQDLKREILTMNSLNHQHIVQLLGISETKHYLNFIGVIPVMIMEFVNGGCLRSYLNSLDRGRGLSKVKENFLLYGKQIADGMNYLEQRKVIHRDLATRNVLMVSESHVKISDFGLARKQMEESDYYKSKTTSDLPVYWYSPECLDTFKFSTKGDVWSYGVTLWEMFTLGDKPSRLLNPVMHNNAMTPYQALVRWYRSGKRLNGTNCDPNVYSIMLKCWDIVSQSRPTFDQLSRQMNDLHTLVSRRNASMSTAHNSSTSTGSTSSASSVGNGVTSPQTPQSASGSFTSNGGVPSTSPVTPISSMQPLGARQSVSSGPNPPTPTASAASSSSNGGASFSGLTMKPVNGFSGIPSIVGSSGSNGSMAHASFPTSRWGGAPLAVSPVLLNGSS